MNKQDSKRVLSGLKDHIAEYYGKGLAQRYEINSMPQTGWDEDCRGMPRAQTINLDFTFDFFLLFQKKKHLGIRVLANFHFIYSQLRTLCLTVLSERTSNSAKVILAKSSINQFKNIKVLLKIINLPTPSIPLRQRLATSWTAISHGVLVSLRHLVITSVGSIQDVSFLEVWKRQCSCPLQAPTISVRRDNLLQFVRLYPEIVESPHCKKCKKALKLSHTEDYKMSFQICKATFQAPVACLSNSVSLFLFEPFINRLKVGDLIDVNAFLILIKKLNKQAKFGIKEVRAVILNLTYSNTVSLPVLQAFSYLGMEDHSANMVKSQYFRQAPVVSRIGEDVQGTTAECSEYSASTLESTLNGENEENKMIYESDIHGLISESARSFNQLCHLLRPKSEIPGFLGLQLTIPMAVLHHSYILQRRGNVQDSDKKLFHHLIISYESHLWKRILMKELQNHNLKELNSCDLQFYQTESNILSLASKIVVLKLTPFINAQNKKEFLSFLSEIERLSNLYNLTISCFVLMEVDYISKSKSIVNQKLNSFFSFIYDFTKSYRPEQHLAFIPSLLSSESSTKPAPIRKICKFRPLEMKKQNCLSLCEVMVFYAKKHSDVSFREIEDLGRYTRAVSRLRCTFELVSKAGIHLKYEEKASDMVMALLLQKMKQMPQIGQFLSTPDYDLTKEATLSQLFLSQPIGKSGGQECTKECFICALKVKNKVEKVLFKLLN